MLKAAGTAKPSMSLTSLHPGSPLRRQDATDRCSTLVCLALSLQGCLAEGGALGGRLKATSELTFKEAGHRNRQGGGGPQEQGGGKGFQAEDGAAKRSSCDAWRPGHCETPTRNGTQNSELRTQALSRLGQGSEVRGSGWGGRWAQT